MKKPSLQFYPGDWRKDPTVMCLSLAARGLWFEMLMLMHESPRRGYLDLTEQQLSRSVGSTPAEVRRVLKELEQAGTFSREAGVIFNRRMVRDDDLSAKRSAAGKIGANLLWQKDKQNYGQGKTLPLPVEGEGEAEVEVTPEPPKQVSEIFPEVLRLYESAGLPIAPKHQALAIQLLMSSPSEKLARLPAYIRHMLGSGRWSSAAKMKGLLNLLRDGDWDVPIIPPKPATRTRDNKRDADESARLQVEAAPWLAEHPGATLNDFVDWQVSQNGAHS